MQHENSSRLTSANGAPVPQDGVSRSAGPRGPLTFDNAYLFEKLAHFNRERIPERVVHARGTGAHGTFTLTQDLSQHTSADFMNGSGKQTDVFVRFSTVGGGQDSSDFARDPRGFAVKFYTDEGNFDLVGNNTPVFFLRDPILFPDFVHSQKKNPRTNVPDPAAVYEFWAANPQSLHQVTVLMSDRGIPQSYRHMNGYASHTLSLHNQKGARVWVKWHFKTDQGVRCVTDDEAAQLPSHGAQADLVEAIERGEFPSWTVKLQVMNEAQAQAYAGNPFDVTKVWPHAEFPLLEIGKFELNRNVENYFAETEQVAFSPSNLVPGTGVSPDRMLQGRLMAYPDAHRYRLGANFSSLPINAPRCPVGHYQRDGSFAGMTADGSAGGGRNFHPNDSPGAPIEVPQLTPPPFALESGASVDHHDLREEDNFTQAGNLFRMFDDSQRTRLAATIAGGLVHASESVRTRMLAQFDAADPDYGARVRTAIENA